MKVLVVLVAEHRAALKLFEQRGDKLLDPSRMPKPVADQVTFVTCTFNPKASTQADFAAFIMSGGTHSTCINDPEIDGVVVLCEQSSGHVLNGLRNAIFVGVIPPIPYVQNLNNFLTGHFRKLLGNYGFLGGLVEDATRKQAWSLPLRNFESSALRAFAEMCTASSLSTEFPNDVTVGLNKLIKLRGPKRRSSFPYVYFKDEQGRYFKYGHERHARYETGGKHLSTCVLQGKFRFGWPLEQDRHFNVTKGSSDAQERLNCRLPNCHDEIVHTRNSTHINMFSNDFHA